MDAPASSPLPHPLTKMEVEMLQRAQQRHVARLTQPRTTRGTTFGSDAFTNSPAVLIFKDCEAGQTYTKTLTITNRSHEKNTFRTQQVPVAVAHLLQVSCPPPGSMAPGTSRDVQVTYRPDTQTDLDCTLTFLAATGPFFVELQGRTKRAVASVTPSLVQFRQSPTVMGVMMGSSREQKVTLKNEGALEVQYEVVMNCTDTEDHTTQEDGRVSLVTGSGFRIPILKGTLSGYSSNTFTVSFSPVAPGEVTIKFSIRFHLTAKPDRSIPNDLLNINEQLVTLVGHGRQCPVYADVELVDFACCRIDKDYKDQLVLRNADRTAMKVVVMTIPETASVLEFFPDVGFCQPEEGLTINITFKPRANTLQLLEKFLVMGQQGVLEIPMKMQVVGQPLPVKFAIRAQLTHSNLRFSPPNLTYGCCNISERRGIPMMILNDGLLPEQFAFTDIPLGMSVEPNQGYGEVLPGSSSSVTFFFQPPIVGPQRFTVTCKTLAGKIFTLAGTAEGIKPPLTLSHTVLQLPATAVGDTSSVSIILRNTASSTQLFELILPGESWLSIVPRVGAISAAASMRLQLDFSPPLLLKDSVLNGDELPAQEHHVIDSDRKEATETPSAAPNALPPSEQPLNPSSPEQQTEGRVSDVVDSSPSNHDEEGQANHHWRLVRHWTIPCFMQPADVSDGDEAARKDTGPPRTSMLQRSGSTENPRQGLTGVMHMNVTTCAVLPDLVLLTPLTVPEGQRHSVLDFGPVPLGTRVVKDLAIENQGTDWAPLRSDPLDPHGGFQVVNALRPLAPCGRFSVLVSFEPTESTHYYEMLHIRSPKMCLRFLLRGQGACPAIRVTPESALTLLDVGDTYQGEAREHIITVTNLSPFQMTVTARFGSRGGEKQAVAPEPLSLKHESPFFCRYPVMVLSAGASEQLTITFCPSGRGPYYQDVLRLCIPHQPDDVTIPLRGASWSEGAFISGPQYSFPSAPLPEVDPFGDVDLNMSTTSSSTTGTTGGAPLPSGKGVPAGPQPPTLSLTLTPSVAPGSTATAQMFLGSLKSKLGGSNSEVVFDELSAKVKEAGWTVEPMKLSVAAGDKKPLTVKYTAPRSTQLMAYTGLDLVEYVEMTLSGTLKGGAPSLGPSGRRVAITCRCLVDPNTRAPAST